MKSLYVATLTCTVLASVLILIGIVTPGWVVINMTINTGGSSGLTSGGSGMGSEGNLIAQPSTATKIQIGASLFYVRACVNNIASICMTVSYTKALSYYHQQQSSPMPYNMDTALEEFTELHIEAALSLILAVIAIIAVVLYVNSTKIMGGTKASGIVGLFSLLLSAILAAVLAAKMLSLNQQLDSVMDILRTATSDMDMGTEIGTPYSVIITGVGVALAFICVVMLIASLCTQRNDQGGHVMQVIQTAGPNVQLGSIVPGVHHVNQGYAVLQEAPQQYVATS